MDESTESVTNTCSTLADPVRRCLLNYLDGQETPVSFDRLATLNQSDMTGPPNVT